MNQPNVLIPEPTAWKPREQAGAAPVQMLPEPTAWKPDISNNPGTSGAIEVVAGKQSWSEIGWQAAGWAGAAATYAALGYLIYHNFRIGARLHTIDMWAKSLHGRIPSAHEIIGSTTPAIGEIAGVLFFGDDDYIGDSDDLDLGIELTPTGRAYQAMHLANTRLMDWGLSLDPIEESDPPPWAQKPPLRILTHNDIADLYDKVSEYQALERVSGGGAFFDKILEH